MAEHGITKTSSSSILTPFLFYCRIDINVVNIYTEFFFFFSVASTTYSQFSLSGRKKSGISMVRNCESTSTFNGTVL
jgi:hypothetical protein